jgi:Fe2+ transport system protein FeoA
MQLSDIKEGGNAIINHVGGNAALRRRIHEMGIIKGSQVYIEKYAPLRDPIELIVKGYHISLRVEEAKQISVETVK